MYSFCQCRTNKMSIPNPILREGCPVCKATDSKLPPLAGSEVGLRYPSPLYSLFSYQRGWVWSPTWGPDLSLPNSMGCSWAGGLSSSPAWHISSIYQEQVGWFALSACPLGKITS